MTSSFTQAHSALAATRYGRPCRTGDIPLAGRLALTHSIGVPKFA